ncbi:hypothetical protein AB0B85_10475 [Micromonospora sp. NPDC049044]|uniref:hypothetical protein n=1 Tax=unclassified Micromonospora TaxID=2617518 RepID=UPI0033FFFA54
MGYADRSRQRRSVPLPRFLIEPPAAQIADHSNDESALTSPAGEVYVDLFEDDLDQAADRLDRAADRAVAGLSAD